MKLPEDTNAYLPSTSQEEGTVTTRWQDAFAELKYMLTTKDGWIGDYVRIKAFARSELILTASGLPLFSNTQHLALEPEIQGLQSSFLWSE